MKSYWSTPQAMKDAPLVAQGMNSADKIVFSRTLDKAEWNNTRVVRDNISEEIKKLKEESARDSTILGSGSIVTQFAQEGFIDEFQIMVHPVALAEGTSIFKGLESQLNLELTSTRAFSSGKALLYYRPGKRK
jgi:dihydrofolate reductase